MNYLDIGDVLAIHEKMIEVGGGREGILDFTLLHSAVERPKATFAGEDLYPTIFQKTAALVHSLVLNHPFSDGNKRTGFVSGVRLLYINGWRVVFAEKEAIDFVRGVQGKSIDFEKIAKWFKKHARKMRTNIEKTF